MRRYLVSLALLLAVGAAPARADYCYGTVYSVSPKTVLVSTNHGVFAVPINSATFQVGGANVGLNSLQPGMPVTVFAPVVTPVQGLQQVPLVITTHPIHRGSGHARPPKKGKHRR